MNREMQKRVTESKQRAAELIRYASPKNGRNMKNCPTIERVTELLSSYIPYREVIASVSVIEYHKNDIIKSAHFRVDTVDGKAFKISAYQNLTGRTQEEKEADKTATFPSGLFNIFHSVIA